MNKKTISKIISALIIFSVITAIFTSCEKKYSEKTSFSMGSVLTAKIFSEDEEKTAEIFSYITSAADEADKALSATDTEGELYTLNKEKKLYASDFLYNTLSDTILLCNVLERKTDITLGKVTSLWGFSTDTPGIPDEKALTEALEEKDLEKILLGTDSLKITIDDSIELDLGAFGKGACLDNIYSSIKLYYTPLIVTLGGAVMAYLEGPSDSKWTVGIRNPFGDADSYFAAMKLAPSSVSGAFFVATSGSYEKQFTENGKTYHHIIDPATGYPVESNLVSVTVVAASGLNADALSTYCFINGYNEETLSTLNSFKADAVFVFNDKTVKITDGLTDSIELTDKEFTVSD